MAVFVAVSFAAFWPSIDGKFISDDRNAIVSNELVTTPDPYAIISQRSWWGSHRTDAAGYRPVTTLSFAANHALGGLDPKGYHLANLILHGVVAWLVFLLALRLDLTATAAWTAGTAFSLLPIHSEAVAWVVGRAELLAAAGYLLALLLLLDYRQHGRRWRLPTAAVIFIAAVLSKENALTLLAVPPLVALVLPGSAQKHRRDFEAWAWLLAALVVVMAIRASVGEGLGRGGDLLDNPLGVLPTATRLLGALSVLGHYLWLLLWPAKLSADYSYNALGLVPGFSGDAYVALALALLAFGAAAAWHYRRRNPAITLSLLLAGSTYSIVSNAVIPIGTIMAERLFYLPSVGICLLLGTAAVGVYGRAPRTTVTVLIAVAVAWLAIDTNRSYDWRSSLELFRSATRTVPHSARAHMELASAYGKADDIEAALVSFKRATDIMPGYAAAWYNKANMLARRGRYGEATEAYRQAITHAPAFEQAWFNLGLTYSIIGQPAQSVLALERAQEIRTTAPVANRQTSR